MVIKEKTKLWHETGSMRLLPNLKAPKGNQSMFSTPGSAGALPSPFRRSYEYLYERDALHETRRVRLLPNLKAPK
jgi:hypothetical protein